MSLPIPCYTSEWRERKLHIKRQKECRLKKDMMSLFRCMGTFNNKFIKSRKYPTLNITFGYMVHHMCKSILITHN